MIRRSEHPQRLTNPRPSFPRDVFFFYEKSSGVAHFHVEAAPDGRFPVDQAAGLLAMHCMVRGQSTSDYVVMVQAEDEILEGLTEKANKLLEAGKSEGNRRQPQSLRAHRKIPCLLAARQVPCARPHGTGARGFASNRRRHANAHAGGDRGDTYSCDHGKKLSRGEAFCSRRSLGQTAIDGLIRIPFQFLRQMKKPPTRSGAFSFFNILLAAATSSLHRRVRRLCPN